MMNFLGFWSDGTTPNEAQGRGRGRDWQELSRYYATL